MMAFLVSIFSLVEIFVKLALTVFIFKCSQIFILSEKQCIQAYLGGSGLYINQNILSIT